MSIRVTYDSSKHTMFSFCRLDGDSGQEALLNKNLGDICEIWVNGWMLTLRLKRIFRWSNGNFTVVFHKEVVY